MSEEAKHLLEALRESQSLLVAILGEKRPDEEIEEQIVFVFDTVPIGENHAENT